MDLSERHNSIELSEKTSVKNSMKPETEISWQNIKETWIWTEAIQSCSTFHL